MPTPLTDRFWDDLESVGRQANERAAETESLRHLPADLAGDMIATGAARLWVPEAYGGSQASVAEVLDAIERCAYWDGSLGWCVMIANTTALNSGYLRADYASQIFGDPAMAACGYGMPAGIGRRVDGGIRVSGHWQWGSGSSHSNWIGGGVRVVEQQPDGTDKTVLAPFVFFDRADVTLIDNWHVAGLKGTGSGDYVVTDAFVPEERWVSFANSPDPVVASPLYRFSFLEALQAWRVDGDRNKRPDEPSTNSSRWRKDCRWSSKGLGERPVVQAELARAEAAGPLGQELHHRFDRCGLLGGGVRNRAMCDESKRLIRLAANHAVEQSVAGRPLLHPWWRLSRS
ncbi:MAG: hypothetical protein R2706_15425 [Acidimicrobiales bacterium]